MSETKKFYPDTFETERLILRCIQKQDAADLYEYAGDAETTKFVTWATYKSIDDAPPFINYIVEKFSAGARMDYAIVLKENNKMIGTGGIVVLSLPHFVELGYIINKKYWGRGLVVEAMKVIMEFLFKNKLVHRIQATHMFGNENSGRVMQKLGMEYEGYSKDKFYKNGKYITLKHYAVLNPYDN